MTLRVLGGSYKSWIENQVRLRAQLLKVQALIYKREVTGHRSHKEIWKYLVRFIMMWQF